MPLTGNNTIAKLFIPTLNISKSDIEQRRPAWKCLGTVDVRRVK